MSDFSPPPLPPPPPPPSLPPSSGGIPWEERERLGLAAAFVETIKRVLFDPVAFFRAMPVTGGLGGPLAFGLLVAYFGFAVSAFYDTIFQSVAGRMFGDLSRGSGQFQRLAELLGGGIGFAFMLLLGPFLLVLALFVGSGITHLVLMLLGGDKRGFEATFRVACFAQATAIFAVVPFCGSLHVIYQIVLTIIGLSEAHQIGKWTAAGAVLLPLLVACCCCSGAIAAMFGGIAGMAGFPR